MKITLQRHFNSKKQSYITLFNHLTHVLNQLSLVCQLEIDQEYYSAREEFGKLGMMVVMLGQGQISAHTIAHTTRHTAPSTPESQQDFIHNYCQDMRAADQHNLRAIILQFLGYVKKIFGLKENEDDEDCSNYYKENSGSQQKPQSKQKQKQKQKPISIPIPKPKSTQLTRNFNNNQLTYLPTTNQQKPKKPTTTTTTIVPPLQLSAIEQQNQFIPSPGPAPAPLISIQMPANVQEKAIQKQIPNAQNAQNVQNVQKAQNAQNAQNKKLQTVIMYTQQSKQQIKQQQPEHTIRKQKIYRELNPKKRALSLQKFAKVQQQKQRQSQNNLQPSIPSAYVMPVAMQQQQQVQQVHGQAIYQYPIVYSHHPHAYTYNQQQQQQPQFINIPNNYQTAIASTYQTYQTAPNQVLLYKNSDPVLVQHIQQNYPHPSTFIHHQYEIVYSPEKASRSTQKKIQNKATGTNLNNLNETKPSVPPTYTYHSTNIPISQGQSPPPPPAKPPSTAQPEILTNLQICQKLDKKIHEQALDILNKSRVKNTRPNNKHRKSLCLERPAPAPAQREEGKHKDKDKDDERNRDNYQRIGNIKNNLINVNNLINNNKNKNNNNNGNGNKYSSNQPVTNHNPATVTATKRLPSQSRQPQNYGSNFNTNPFPIVHFHISNPPNVPNPLNYSSNYNLDNFSSIPVLIKTQQQQQQQQVNRSLPKPQQQPPTTNPSQPMAYNNDMTFGPRKNSLANLDNLNKNLINIGNNTANNTANNIGNSKNSKESSPVSLLKESYVIYSGDENGNTSKEITKDNKRGSQINIRQQRQRQRSSQKQKQMYKILKQRQKHRYNYSKMNI